ncbi:MAG: hypothetical protein US86_C0007G0068 [Candidatus Daviesbacteria bacterium GW2011_GWA2_38_24]|uniref:Uncharacterized protein n=1 Tax=Candidatus Daviesbacteria bacterium GW2011_GWA2_38_24 TaxID=1618422 RepID=A0A0G0JEC2_9BACT|nr:MAG: hypothetical protein US86_C0007G0068 [Candidatus Daviesbacteria bacterium GW2011_GWA2_38_24]KKQ81000.1 MAG: hypothetical protein UT01_C0002G0027 [Candidatus Daviesbacteria bacterium GW2011_GWA1_38_7]OGE23782.1 MAG: hypothetical protein A2688_03320 [Candidatus Daviesbacteria bacterium RIFCSPHIGHO2_01_FULL_38_8]
MIENPFISPLPAGLVRAIERDITHESTQVDHVRLEAARRAKESIENPEAWKDKFYPLELAKLFNQMIGSKLPDDIRLTEIHELYTRVYFSRKREQEFTKRFSDDVIQAGSKFYNLTSQTQKRYLTRLINETSLFVDLNQFGIRLVMPDVGNIRQVSLHNLQLGLRLPIQKAAFLATAFGEPYLFSRKTLDINSSS